MGPILVEHPNLAAVVGASAVVGATTTDRDAFTA